MTSRTYTGRLTAFEEVRAPLAARTGCGPRAMSTFITLQDGRLLLERNWVYDAILRAVARELRNDDEGRALAEWLLAQQCFEQGPGIGYLDLRELTPSNQPLIIESLRLALGAPARRDHLAGRTLRHSPGGSDPSTSCYGLSIRSSAASCRKRSATPT
jgi:hypothetical protein